MIRLVSANRLVNLPQNPFLFTSRYERAFRVLVNWNNTRINRKIMKKYNKFAHNLFFGWLQQSQNIAHNNLADNRWLCESIAFWFLEFRENGFPNSRLVCGWKLGPTWDLSVFAKGVHIQKIIYILDTWKSFWTFKNAELFLVQKLHFCKNWENDDLSSKQIAHLLVLWQRIE